MVLRLTVGAADDSGHRELAVYSRPEDALPEEPWTTHATGLLGHGGSPVEQHAALTEWPPPGAEEADVEGLYADSAEAGFAYGPVFQGVRAAWRRGQEVFAEVALPEDADATAFGIHPALLDAALHAVGYGDLLADDGEARLPFSWNRVALQAAHASELRVRLAPAGDNAISVTVADGTGAPVASAASLSFRAVSADQLSVSRGPASDSLFHLDGRNCPPPHRRRTRPPRRSPSSARLSPACRTRPCTPTSPRSRTSPTPSSYGCPPHPVTVRRRTRPYARPPPGRSTWHAPGWRTSGSPTRAWCWPPRGPSRPADALWAISRMPLCGA